ncbi:hypothetical protein SPSIL_035920 [Sporomusa silvacetica DSM 10669]|uniref:Uncharacterized protein n=1 Tax=Sporomusa silvacetica DSM 10669 TaxID=1123289 RepID=A0ABZ3IPP9_9FIRM|nr:hypothetical protein [Sporomusa silvacetica]OZC14056.1 hypothetical protein SPSIL_50990 [Sporomusa silvacetica DSM 10669]
MKREKEDFEKAVRRLLEQTFACQKDAEQALASFHVQNKKKLWALKGSINSTTQVLYKRGRRPANQPPQVDRTNITWHIKSDGIEQHQENIAKKTRQLMTFVLITNVPETTMDDQAVLFTYKGQSVVEVQFHLLKTQKI